MNKMFVTITLLGCFISGCSTIDPARYEGINYTKHPSQEYTKLTSIEIIKKKKSATVEEVLPLIKMKVYELNLDKQIFISNVKIIPFRKARKKIDSYQVCTDSQPVVGANNHRSKTPYINSVPSNCTTKYTEITKMLDYLRITADVFSLPETITL